MRASSCGATLREDVNVEHVSSDRIMVMVVVQLGLYTLNAPTGTSSVVSVGLGIAALVVLDRKRSR